MTNERTMLRGVMTTDHYARPIGDVTMLFERVWPLESIWDLLGGGVNAKVVLHKDDGGTATYDLVKAHTCSVCNRDMLAEIKTCPSCNTPMEANS
jgi:hypothetical protein